MTTATGPDVARCRYPGAMRPRRVLAAVAVLGTLVGCGGGDDDRGRQLTDAEVRVIEKVQRSNRRGLDEQTPSVRRLVREGRALCREGERAGPTLRAIGPACLSAVRGSEELDRGLGVLASCDDEDCLVPGVRRIAVATGRLQRSLETYRARTEDLDVPAACRDLIVGSKPSVDATRTLARSADRYLGLLRELEAALDASPTAEPPVSEREIGKANDDLFATLERWSSRIEAEVRSADAEACRSDP